MSPSSSVLLLAKTITHPAARSLCDSWASCYLGRDSTYIHLDASGHTLTPILSVEPCESLLPRRGISCLAMPVVSTTLITRLRKKHRPFCSQSSFNFVNLVYCCLYWSSVRVWYVNVCRSRLPLSLHGKSQWPSPYRSFLTVPVTVCPWPTWSSPESWTSHGKGLQMGHSVCWPMLVVKAIAYLMIFTAFVVDSFVCHVQENYGN